MDWREDGKMDGEVEEMLIFKLHATTRVEVTYISVYSSPTSYALFSIEGKGDATEVVRVYRKSWRYRNMQITMSL